MIAFFDTSAIVPLLIDEPGSHAARRIWDGASRIVGVVLVYPEARAALAQARRVGRLTTAQLRNAVDTLDERYLQLDVVNFDEGLARHAGELAEAHGLRAYDAVHLAAAHRVADADLVLVAGDRALLVAAEAVGMTVAAIG